MNNLINFNASTAAEGIIRLLITCCNQGRPTDYLLSLSNTTLSNQNSTVSNETESLASQLFPECQQFSLQLPYRDILPSLSPPFCSCPSGFSGSQCQIQQAWSTGSKRKGGSRAVRVFIYLAIIPLTFGLVVAIMALCCRNPCIQDCYAKMSRYYRGDGEPENEISQEAIHNYAQTAYQRCLTAERRRYGQRFNDAKPGPIRNETLNASTLAPSGNSDISSESFENYARNGHQQSLLPSGQQNLSSGSAQSSGYAPVPYSQATAPSLPETTTIANQSGSSSNSGMPINNSNQYLLSDEMPSVGHADPPPPYYVTEAGRVVEPPPAYENCVNT